MRKLLVSIVKEKKLLIRDIEGIALLFVMPVTLVIFITLLQDRSFQNVLETQIDVIIVDHDHDSLSHNFRQGIKASQLFNVTEITLQNPDALEKARKDVVKGKYQIGIYIPENTTRKVKMRALNLVKEQLPFSIHSLGDSFAIANIKLFFDPITKSSFKNLAKGKLNEFAAQTETRVVFETYSRVIDAITNQSHTITYPPEPIISFEEDLISEYTGGIIPNSVQHNIPAWTLFGMFLICIPIAGNIIKERNDGCLARLKTLPVSYLTMMSGKATVFIVICLIQALLIILIGIYIMPLLNLPQLQIKGNWAALFITTLASAFAATGFGVAIGTISSTIVQASTFGSVTTVILAAIGGIWIPVSVMSESMRKISEFSPMNWGIQAYYDVFLRNAGSIEIMPAALKLMLFYCVCVFISILFRKYRAVN
jgi:ABC-2 type transport system permease protein